MEKDKTKLTESASVEDSAEETNPATAPVEDSATENALTPEQAKDEKRLKSKKELIRSLKYLCFTCSAGAIQLGASTLFWQVFHWSYWTGYLIALALSVIWNFTFNRKFTFKSANNVPIAMLKVFGYYCVFTPLSTLWGHALANVGWNNYAIEIPTMVINAVTEFLFCRFIVFGKSINTNKLGQKEEQKDKAEHSHEE